MKWVALFLLFLVACSMPQPVIDDNKADVSSAEKSLDVENISKEPVTEPKPVTIEKQKQEADTVEVSEEPEAEKVEEPSADNVSADNISSDEDEVESGIHVKISPITASVVGPPKKEKLALDAKKVMNHLIGLFSKINSYEFRTDYGKFFVRGDKFKIILSKPIRAVSLDEHGAKSQDVISTVYVDRKLKTAVGYCEGKDTGLRRECEENDLLDVPKDLFFNEFNRKLPEDWLWGLIEEKIDFVETDKYYVNSKKVIRVFFTLNNTNLDVFFDEETGLPVRIISIKDGKSSTIDFVDLNANSVKKFEVIHRNLENIPSEEYFYK